MDFLLIIYDVIYNVIHMVNADNIIDLDYVKVKNVWLMPFLEGAIKNGVKILWEAGKTSICWLVRRISPVSMAREHNKNAWSEKMRIMSTFINMEFKRSYHNFTASLVPWINMMTHMQRSLACWGDSGWWGYFHLINLSYRYRRLSNTRYREFSGCFPESILIYWQGG